MTGTDWRLQPGKIEERAEDYSAYFHCTNLTTGESVTVTLQQKKKRPVSDLIGACLALAQLLQNTSVGESDQTEPVGSRMLN